MRDHLVGYVLGALDPAEHEMVEANLATDPSLSRELELIRRSLRPLAADSEHYDPPAGLAHRTCQFVAMQTRTAVAPPLPAAAAHGWTVTDLLVAASIFLAATLLFFPALNQSRFAMRVAGCQNNLRQIGMALSDYSEAHNGYFPNVPLDGNLAAAGIYAPRLLERGLIDGHNVVLCPASPQAERPNDFRIPAIVDLERAPQSQLPTMHRQMGGSYGYNMGYITNGSYQATKNRHRPTFALVADAPQTKAPYHSANHGSAGQNVLFEDGHVQYLTTCKAHHCNDDIYVNDEGTPGAPGLHVDDAVLATSETRPTIVPVKSKPLSIPSQK